MAAAQLITQLVETLTQPEFHRVALRYLSDVEGLKRVIDINGPYDSGLDFTDMGSDGMVQFQATVESSESKLRAKFRTDFLKAKENVEQYALSKKVIYFYGKSLSERKVLETKKTALDDYGLILELVDARRIGGISEIFTELGSFIVDISGLNRLELPSDYFDSEKVRAFYELMTNGTMSDVKYSILKSFIVHHLYENNSASKVELLQFVNTQFNSSFNSTYFSSVLNKLKSEQRVVEDKGTAQVSLSTVEFDRIEGALKEYKLEETLLTRKIQEVLTHYGIDVSICDGLIIQIAKVYESNYSINLSEFVSHTGDIRDFATATKTFKTWLRSKLDKALIPRLPNLISDLLAVCDGNFLLKTIASGEVISKVSDPDRLQDYLIRNKENVPIFVDANVLLFLVCAAYNPSSKFQSYKYQVARQLADYVMRNNIQLSTIRSYAYEVLHHMRDAIAILPFTQLAFYDQLGGSRNVFFNFFQHMKDNGELEEDVTSFHDFLDALGFGMSHGPDYTYRAELVQLMRIIQVDIADGKHYEITRTMDLIYKEMKKSQGFKAPLAVKNDAIMIERLADENTDVNPLDPIFCTWDFSLIPVRTKYFEKHPACTKWYFFTPARLMDHFSMMEMRIRPGAVTREVIALLNQELDIKEHAQSLLDSLQAIINPSTPTGFKYAKKLAEIRRQSDEIATKEDVLAGTPSFETNAVDYIFTELYVHFHSKDNSDIMDRFRNLFKREELYDVVIERLTNEVEHVRVKKRISEDLFSDIVDLMSS